MTTNNVVQLTPRPDGRREEWRFPDGTVVVMEVPAEEEPITVKHAVFILGAIVHHLHTVME
jgi:hypothetical protein